MSDTKQQTIQNHIDEHLKEENSYIKSVYCKSMNGDGNLPENLHIRFDECSISSLTAPKNNVIHIYKGTINKLNITEGLVYLDGVNIQEITGDKSRIRISDDINQSKSTIYDLDLTDCELEVFNSEFRGKDMLKSIKKSRVNVVNSNIQCQTGGKLEDSSFTMLKNDITLHTKGWDMDKVYSQYTSVKIKMNGSIPLHAINNSYISLADTEIDSKKVQFVGNNYSGHAENTKFIGGCRAFEINDTGFIRMNNCDCDNLICIKLKGAGTSCTWKGGKGNGKEYGVEVLDGASATLIDLEKLEGGQVGIKADNKSYILAENIQNIKGGESACKASSFSSMDLKDCKYEAPIAFKGDEGTFLVRGDKTVIAAGKTADGSGSFIIDDEDDCNY